MSASASNGYGSALPTMPQPITEVSNDDNLTFTTYESKWQEQYTPFVTVKAECTCQSPIEGNPLLVEEINRWICETFGDNDHDYIDAVESLLQSYARDAFEGLKEMADLTEVDYETCLEMTVSVDREFENSDYVTLSCTSFEYMGGAHGLTSAHFATFRKSDGMLMDWALLSDMEEEAIAEAIKADLKEQFGFDDEELLNELLIDPDDYYNHFPLPVTPPFLVQSGVECLYQQYEIAPYVMGMPSATVKTLKEFEANPPQPSQKVTGTDAVATDGPGYPGGQEALMAYLAQNIVYPAEAEAFGIEGTVKLQFLVEKDGSIGVINVIESLNAEAVPMSKAQYMKQNKGKTDADYKRYVSGINARNMAGEACNAEAARVLRTLPKFESKGYMYWFSLPVTFHLK